MSFLGNLGNFVSTAGPIAAQIGGDYEQAQAQGSQQRNQQALQMLMLQRQQRQQEIENVYKQAETARANAQTGYFGARQNSLENPKAPVAHYTPVPNTFDKDGNPIGAVLDNLTGQVTPTGFAGKPLPVQKDPTPHYTTVTTTDPTTGQQHVSRFNTLTGQLEDTGVQSKVAPTGQGGMGALSPGAIQGMYEQAQHADAVMKAFEEKYRTNPGSLGTGSQALGAGAYQHQTGFLSGLAGAASNAALGMTNKDYQEYLAAQKRFGNIMGNLMSRRYSEYQGALDTQLAGLSSGDVEPTINLKQSYRADLLHNRPAGGHTAPSGGGAVAQPVIDPVLAEFGIGLVKKQ